MPAQQAYPLTWPLDGLAVGPAPMSYAQLDSLKDQGVNAILNLCAEFTDLHQIETQHGFEVFYLPIEDEDAPRLEPLEKALDWLDESRYLGKKVLIHCRHGLGRTGTVLNAYLLRRGLSRKEADRVLRTLRSKPTNFVQWRTVVKYGKLQPRLTVREPTLEFKRSVDLGSFFQDLKGLVVLLEKAIPEQTPRCGRDNTTCCRGDIQLSFIESVHLQYVMNTMLSSEERFEVMARAREPEAAFWCPLSEDERCEIFDQRPVSCRLGDLPAALREKLAAGQAAPILKALSRDIFLAFTAEFALDDPPFFPLREVVSGKYVEYFFKLLAQAGAK